MYTPQRIVRDRSYTGSMKSRLFGLFCELIDHTPVEGVLPVIQVEHRMMEEDFAWKRVSLTEEVNSVWSFCNFLLTAGYGCGSRIASTILPLEHFAFYRNTVERLVEAGELPDDAKNRFDDAFSTSWLSELTTAVKPSLSELATAA